MSRYMNSKYASMAEYVPGEQPRDKKYIKLNTNESPFPPSPGVFRAIDASRIEDLRLYADPTCRALREKLSKLYSVVPECIYLAGGSDDILNFAFMAFGERGAVYPAISYGFYSVFARLHEISTEEIPLSSDFSIDPTEYYGKNSLVVIANPNAPTGLMLGLDDIEKIIINNPDGVVVIDEAYIDFGGESALPLIQKYDNLLVVRTYSKSRSMAGARLGYAFGSPALIADLEKLKYSTNPYNISALTQAVGLAALDENDYYMENCRRIIENREYTQNELRKLGFTVTDSKTNFVFAKTDKMSGEELYRRLREEGILVRHFGAPEICEYNRITVGTLDDMKTVVSAVKKILESVK